MESGLGMKEFYCKFDSLLDSSFKKARGAKHKELRCIVNCKEGQRYIPAVRALYANDSSNDAIKYRYVPKTISLGGFYKRYRDGENMEELAKNLAESLAKEMTRLDKQASGKIKNFENVKNRIYLAPLNSFGHYKKEHVHRVGDIGFAYAVDVSSCGSFNIPRYILEGMDYEIQGGGRSNLYTDLMSLSVDIESLEQLAIDNMTNALKLQVAVSENGFSKELTNGAELSLNEIYEKLEKVKEESGLKGKMVTFSSYQTFLGEYAYIQPQADKCLWLLVMPEVLGHFGEILESDFVLQFAYLPHTTLGLTFSWVNIVCCDNVSEKARAVGAEQKEYYESNNLKDLIITDYVFGYSRKEKKLIVEKL